MPNVEPSCATLAAGVAEKRPALRVDARAKVMSSFFILQPARLPRVRAVNQRDENAKGSLFVDGYRGCIAWLETA